MSKEKLELNKLLLKAIVAPNLRKWFAFQTITYSDRYGRDKNTYDVEYATIDFVHHSKDYKGNPRVEKIRVYLIDSPISSKFFYQIGRFINEKNPSNGTSIHTTSARSLSTSTEWDAHILDAVIEVAAAHPEFEAIKQTLDIETLLEKERSRKSKQKEYSEKKRAVKFTFTDQKRIAKVLANLIMDKTGNYLLKILNERISAADADTTGESLAEAMSIYNLDKNDIINALTSSTDITARRFAAMFAENSIIALVDKDKTVRLAAKARQVKRKEEQSNDAGDTRLDQ